MATKKHLRKAFQLALDKKGYSLVEIVSPCPTNWGMNPPEAMKWLKDEMLGFYELGVFKDITAES
jgi:2-oxoglutarate ferredoxin oxidoreductase subunit beta